MKKFLFLLNIAFCFMLTGCIKRDTMEDITIYTSVYPIEYITDRLYGNNSKVLSIYPDGVIPNLYSLNDKQIRDYSKAELFVFNGLSDEKNYLEPMLKSNRDLKIIDSTLSMEFTNRSEELWLDPDNALMIARNIKAGFNEYINNHYLKNQVEENYESLKLDLSNLSAKLNLVSSSSSDSTIVVSDNLFKFLEKYGFNVISLNDGSSSEKNISEARKRILNGQTKYLFIIKDEDLDSSVQALIDETNVEKLEFNTLSSLSDTERSGKKDYVSIMLENIALLKQELYK